MALTWGAWLCWQPLLFAPRLAMHTTGCRRCCRGEDSREGRLLVKPQQHALLQLGAALYFHHAWDGGGVDSAGLQQQQGEGGRGPRQRVLEDSSEDEELPLPASKRRKVRLE